MLENLNPREFEEYCQALFMQYFQCSVDLTPSTGDEGRDLLVHHPQGLRVVECKHYPRGTVGRPVVQKLHSAILTASARDGIIVTTGKFSTEAEDYTAKLQDVKIELIDAAKLACIISLCFPSGPKASDLARAVVTTSDKNFPEVFAKSIFGPTRYRRAVDCSVAVKVTRTTKYLPFFLANFHAEGSRKTAGGLFSESWSGNAWVGGDGNGAGIGYPLYGSVEEKRRSTLTVALEETAGKVKPPVLQPHQALAKMREFLAKTLVRKKSYTGRNNRWYRVAVRPNINKVHLESCVLCYLPIQDFSLGFTTFSYQGELVEEGEAFRVICPALSRCSICGGSTSAANQILCAFCLRPAHRWKLLSPDSYECDQCKALVCRDHIGRQGKKRVCKLCRPDARPLPPRWLPFLFLGASFSVFAGLVELVFPGSQVIWDLIIFVSGWSPMVGFLLKPALSGTPKTLLYSKSMVKS